jgi:hypothetical protein
MAFWLALFLALGLFAGVALAPRLLDQIHLSRAFQRNQARLAELERQVERLDRVILAQRSDPAFAREQARADFGSDFELSSSDEQRLPVAGHLTLSIGASDGGRPGSTFDLPWYEPLVRLPVESRRTSNLLLTLAATLIIAAFTYLPEKGDRSIFLAGPRPFSRHIRHRWTGRIGL